MRQKKMDISPDTETPLQAPGAARPIPLLRRPLAPWLRLAHVTSLAPEHATHTARMRVLDDFELVLQMQGSCWIWSEPDAGSVDVRAGEVAFIPPGFLHAWASEPGAHIAVHFDLQAKPALAAFRNIRPAAGTVQRRPLARMPCFRLTGLAGTGDQGLVLPLVTKLRAPGLWRERLEPLVQLWSRRTQRSLSGQLRAAETLGWALRTLAADAAHAGLGAAEHADPRILELLRALDAAELLPAPERPAVDELAERAGMGLTAFRAAFQQATGRGPRRYLEERRVERAARALLETGRKVHEIARAEGYEDPYHFSRVFKRVWGASPGKYRRKARTDL